MQGKHTTGGIYGAQDSLYSVTIPTNSRLPYLSPITIGAEQEV